VYKLLDSLTRCSDLVPLVVLIKTLFPFTLSGETPNGEFPKSNPSNFFPPLSPTSIFSLDELSKICDQNEMKAAKNSLNAELIHWKDGRKIICTEWIENLLADLSLTAEKFNMNHLLKPIYRVLEEGNQSMKWIKQYEKGLSIEEIMKFAIYDMEKSEKESI